MYHKKLPKCSEFDIKKCTCGFDPKKYETRRLAFIFDLNGHPSACDVGYMSCVEIRLLFSCSAFSCRMLQNKWRTLKWSSCE